MNAYDEYLTFIAPHFLKSQIVSSELVMCCRYMRAKSEPSKRETFYKYKIARH